MSDQTKQTSIRMEIELYEKIEKLSKKEKRSISGQIEYIIKKFFELRD